MDLRAGVAAVVAGVEQVLAAAADAHAMPAPELTAAVVELMQATDRLAAAHARLLALWDREGAWADDGSRAPWARLARETRCAPATARRLLARARALVDLDEVAEAFAEGHISADVATLFTRASGDGRAELMAEDQGMLLAHVAEMHHDDAERVIRYWCQVADEVLHKDVAGRLRAGRHLSAARGFEGCLELTGRLDPLAGEVFMAELDRLEAELARAGRWEAEGLTTLAQRRADALVEMARRSAAASAAERAPVPLISVLVGLETFVGRVWGTGSGTVVPPDPVREWLADAEVERIVFDGPARVVEVGRRRRFFTGAARRAIEVRDRHCAHPGCYVPADACQVDHVVPWEAGGPTTVDNGRLLCAFHNRWWWNDHQRHGPPPAEGPPLYDTG